MVNIPISYMKIMMMNLRLNLIQTCMVLPVKDGFLAAGESGMMSEHLMQ